MFNSIVQYSTSEKLELLIYKKIKIEKNYIFYSF